MPLDDIIRNAILTADSVTKSLQVNVIHRAWIDSDNDGEHVLDAPILRPAIVEYKRRMVRTAKGDIIQQQASVMFLQIVEANGAVGRREPVDPRDEITLPDGHIGPIISVVGPPTDPNTNRPYLVEVALG